jgi:hypothetical protein
MSTNAAYEAFFAETMSPKDTDKLAAEALKSVLAPQVVAAAAASSSAKRVTETTAATAAMYLDTAARDQDDKGSEGDDEDDGDKDDGTGFVANSPVAQTRGFSHAAAAAAFDRASEQSPSFLAARNKAKHTDELTRNLPTVGSASPARQQAVSADVAVAAAAAAAVPVTAVYELKTLPIPEALIAAAAGTKREPPKHGTEKIVPTTAAQRRSASAPASKTKATINGATTKKATTRKKATKATKAVVTALAAKAAAEATFVPTTSDERDGALILNHLFGEDLFAMEMKMIGQLMYAKLAPTLGDAEAVRVCEESMAQSTNESIEESLSVSTMAMNLLLFCRSHLVDQALGITVKTSSVPDKETLIELTKLVRHPTLLIDAAAEIRAAACLAPTKDRCIDAKVHTNDLPFLLLDGFGAFTSVRVGRHADVPFGNSRCLHADAVAFLGDTRAHRHGYKSAVACMTARPSMFGIGHNLIDVDLTQPWLLKRPRAAIFRGTAAPTRSKFDATVLTFEYLLVPPNASTASAPALEKLHIASAPALPPPPPTTTATTTASMSAPPSRKRASELSSSAAVTLSSIATETPPAKKMAMTAQAPLAVMSEPAVTAWRLVGGVTLVRDRAMVTRDVTQLLAIYADKVAIVPNSTMMKLFNLYLRAHNRPLDWDSLFIVSGLKRLRSINGRDKDDKTGYLANNIMSTVFTALAESELSPTDTVQSRTAQLNRPFTATEKVVLSTRSLVQSYIADRLAEYVPEMQAWDLPIMHVLVTFLRLNKQIAQQFDFEPPGIVSVAAAEIDGARLSVMAGDTKGEPIFLMRNEIPAQCSVLIAPLMLEFLNKMYARYVEHLERTTSYRAATGTPAEFAQAHKKVKFTGPGAWVAEYFTKTASQIDIGDTERMRALFVPIMHALFPTACYNRMPNP